jgi:hypothetical protein
MTTATTAATTADHVCVCVVRRSSSSSTSSSTSSRTFQHTTKRVVVPRQRRQRRQRAFVTIDDGLPTIEEEQRIDKVRLLKDKNNRLIYEPIGYVLRTVSEEEEEEEDDYERVTLSIGAIDNSTTNNKEGTREQGEQNQRRKRTFMFRKVLNTESSLIVYESQRPLGIIFEVDTFGFLRVVDFNPTSKAYQNDKVQRLQPQKEVSQSPVIGDVLRGFTTVSIKYGPRAQLLGDLSGTKRMVVTYGCDNQETDSIFKALRLGTVADGAMTLVLERAKIPSKRMNWKPEEIKIDDAKLEKERKQITIDNGFSTANVTYLVSLASFLLLLLAGFSG